MEQARTGVELRPYDPEAPRIFRQLERSIGDTVPFPLRVEHVGSTAVPGLGGKGIIDCLVIAETPEAASRVCAILRAHGFGHSAHERPEEDRWFASGPLRSPGQGPLHVHIHITDAGSHCAWEMLAFRDYLQHHPEDAAQYYGLKLEWTVP